MISKVYTDKQNRFASLFSRTKHPQMIMVSIFLYLVLQLLKNLVGPNQIYGVIFLVLMTFFSLPKETSRKISGGILFSIFFSCLVIVWGWFGPLSSQLVNIFFDIVSCFALSYVLGIWLKPQEFSIHRFIGINILKSSLLTLTFILIPIRSILKVLTWGYDNSAHIPAFFQVYSHNGFVFAGDISPENTFSNYLNGYPPLQSATWAAVLRLTSTGDLEPTNFLRLYFFFYIATIFLTLYMAIKIVTHSQSKLKYSRLALPFAIVIFFSAYSNVFWSGYPSFEWGVIHCLIWFSIYVNPNLSVNIKLITGILSSGLIFYSYQLLLPPVAILICFLIFRFLRKENLSQNSLKWVTSALLFSLTIGLPFLSISRNTPTFVLNTGGIEPIPFSLMTFLFVVLWVISSRIKVKQVSDAFQIIQVLFVYFAVLAAYSQLENGAISYYIQKVGYLLLLCLTICLLMLLANFKLASINRNPMISFLLALSMILTSSLPFLPKSFSSAFMGGTVQIAQTLILESKGQYRNRGAECVLNSLEYSDPDTSPFNIKVLLPSEVSSGDIESRWLNSIDMRLSDAVYELLIPIGMKSDSITHVLKTWSEKYPNYRLTIYADETANTETIKPGSITRVSC